MIEKVYHMMLVGKSQLLLKKEITYIITII